MMALLWDDIAGDIAASKMHLGQAVTLYRTRMSEPLDYVTSMAFQHAMQAGYTSFETTMKRLLHLLGEPVPVGPDWHAALVKRLGRPVEGGRPRLLDDTLLGAAEELRRFRHIAMHAYEDFHLRKAAIPVEAAERFLAEIDAAMIAFRTAVDPS